MAFSTQKVKTKSGRASLSAWDIIVSIFSLWSQLVKHVGRDEFWSPSCFLRQGQQQISRVEAG